MPRLPLRLVALAALALWSDGRGRQAPRARSHRGGCPRTPQSSHRPPACRPRTNPGSPPRRNTARPAPCSDVTEIRLADEASPATPCEDAPATGAKPPRPNHRGGIT